MKTRHDLGKLRDLIANISGKQQVVVNRKTPLQTIYGHSHTGKLNLVYFGPQKTKNKARSSDPPTGHSSDDWTTDVNNSVAFARWQQRRAATKLSIATHTSCYCVTFRLSVLLLPSAW